MHNRFLFDADFSPNQLVDQDGKAVLDHPQSDLEKIQYERGLRDGHAAATEAIDAKMLILLEEISAVLNGIRTEQQNHVQDLENTLVAIVFDIARYFVSELDPVAVITNPQFGIADLIEKTGRGSQLKLTLSPEDTVNLRDRLLASKIEVSAIAEDSEMEPGQFELSWPEGGMIFDKRRLDNAYNQLLAQYLMDSPGAHDD